MRRIDDIALWELFEGCVKTGSLAKAALAQNMELSAASRLMAALEHEIGFALLDRSVRPAAPTAAAQRLCPAARKIVRARRDAQTLICAIAEEQRIARTTRHVCISLPVNLNRAEVLRALSEYERHAARLKIEVSADSGIPALLSGKTDISLASYSLDDPALFRQFIAHGFTFLMATQR
jgi:DNA-binding transcriptional LysR family regulator